MSRSAPDLSRIELLILARLSVRNKPPGQSDLATMLSELAAPAASKGEWKIRLGELLAALRERDLIDARRRLTESGKAALRDAFGAVRVPSWTEVRDRLLPALALGIDGGSKIVADGEKLQAALVAKKLGLANHGTLASLFDDLVAIELKLPGGKVSMDLIRAHLLARRAGVLVRGKPPKIAQQIAGQIAASAVGAPRAEARQLRAALVRRWFTDDGYQASADKEVLATPATTILTPAVSVLPASPTPPSLSDDDNVFVAMIEDAIHEIGPDGRFGPYKVFIAAIWRQLSRDPRRNGMSLDDLKLRLLDANRIGLVKLARADLVGAMDRDEVATSEIADRGATFHFVLDASRLP